MWKSFLLSLLLALSPFSLAQKAEPIGKPDVPQAVAVAVEDHGLRVLDKDGTPLVSFWPAKTVPTSQKDVEGPTYPQLDISAFLGVIRFEEEGKDFRGQTVPKETYTLRYALLPDDGNHMGVAPNRDFLLLLPLIADADPKRTFTDKQLYRVSSKVAGGSHPTVLSLIADDGQPGTVTTTTEGYLVLHFTVSGSGGAFPMALIVRGVAQQ